ncbi:MAG: YhdH/YhfP family quinone oxidoreductase [Pseudomonadales bacterium]|nr:YhdH/YhfP family quinone oxidoreductase [Pseudomonadales bacterium]
MDGGLDSVSSYRAFRVHRSEQGSLARSIEELDDRDLPAGELLVEVHYSSLNFKDALSATGHPGVTRHFPHTPGIDAAGVVIESETSSVQLGEEVIAIGFDLGMNTPGGFGQRVRIPSHWAVPRPADLSLEESMALGTAGFTAAACLDKLEVQGMRPSDGPVLVTGATGGVGSVAVGLLSGLGYEVYASTGKPEQSDYLRRLGASRVLDRNELADDSGRPLGRETWAGCVDTVGGSTLASAIKSLRYGGSVACCGLVGGTSVSTSVFPFLLRHVNLLGVDSAEMPEGEKKRIWNRLADEWRVGGVEMITRSLRLEGLSEAIDQILAGRMVGRRLIDLRSS